VSAGDRIALWSIYVVLTFTMIGVWKIAAALAAVPR
jgi:hypothetical protein